jgi:Domain of unknown function (DUF4832)/Domain of unknown function (DUF4874)
MKKTLTLLLFFVLIFFSSPAQQVKKAFQESDEIILNPERGFYIPSGTKASHFVPLDAGQIAHYRNKDQHPGGARYTLRVSLLYRSYELDSYKHQALPDSFLVKVQHDFDEVRKAGLKIILRFAYTNSTKGGTCTDEYKICPPYGDAPAEIVFRHVEQLKPLLQRNADIIAVLQEGFIGIWGENYFTDYFGDPSGNGTGTIPDSSWVLRNKLLRSLLDALPRSRMVQVRTPQIKQRFIYGPHAAIDAAPLKEKDFQPGSDIARIGFHNDCFLASADDYGTFYDYGNETRKRDTANQRLRNYFKADSRYVAVGGETCDDAYSPQNDCAPYGHAENEMETMHYSYLNSSYNNTVNNDWDSLGCMKHIMQSLGYRLVLKTAEWPRAAKAGDKIGVDLQLENKGNAAPFNPRPVQLVLRNTQTNELTVFDFKAEVRSWFTGPVRLKQQVVLPTSLKPGTYSLLLNLPDEFKSLRNNSAYSIRLANEDVWEEKSGMNRLGEIVVK